MSYQIFFSPQVKQWAIITYKHGIYQLPRELPNDRRLRKYREIDQAWKNDSPVPRLPPTMKALLTLAENFWKTEIKLFALCAASHKN